MAPTYKHNAVTKAQLLESIERYSRAPFQNTLAQLLEAQPTPERLAQWAVEHPDKWIAGISVIARLAGFSDETVIQHHFNYDEMSDAQLLQRLQEMRAKLALPSPATPGDIIDVPTLEAPESHGQILARDVEREAEEQAELVVVAIERLPYSQRRALRSKVKP